MSTIRPNVVLFISDQQRWDTIGANGVAAARTPHLDRLARSGTLFSRAFCATPMCSPSRASMLSGQLPHRNGMVSNHQGRPGCDRIHLSPDVPLIADYLGAAGYRTAYCGKWHLGTGSDRRGFRDYVVRAGDGEGDVDTPGGNDLEVYAERIGVQLSGKKIGREADRDRFDKRIYTGPSLWDLADSNAMFFCNRAEQFIRSQDGEQPFLLIYSCIEPHIPFVCPEPFFSMIDPDALELPASVADTSGRWLTERACWQLRSTADLSERDLQVMWAAYLGTCAYVDYLAGRLLAALTDAGLLDDTLFIFTSDHGEMMGSHGLLAKGASFYDELMRIPLIVRPPGASAAHGAAGRERARICDALLAQVDLVPTILDYCGVTAPEPSVLDGVSFRSLIDGGDQPVRNAVPGEYHSSNWTDPMAPLRMWRTTDWKYVESFGEDHELYDLVNDPGENRNLAGGSAHAATQEQLAAELHDALRRSGDSWPEVAQPSAADMAARDAAPEQQSPRY